MNVIVMILMMIFMIGIIIFGWSNADVLLDTISESDLVEARNDVRDIVEFCNDPMNKGSRKIKEITHSNVDMICFLSKDNLSEFNSMGSSVKNQVKSINTTGDNVIFGKVKKRGSSGSVTDFTVVDSFEMEGMKRDSSKCYEKGNDNKLVIKMSCD